MSHLHVKILFESCVYEQLYFLLQIREDDYNIVYRTLDLEKKKIVALKKITFNNLAGITFRPGLKSTEPQVFLQNMCNRLCQSLYDKLCTHNARVFVEVGSSIQYIHTSIFPFI